MGITLKMVGLILIPFAVVWTMNPGEIDMACVNLQHLKGQLSSPFVKYVMVMRKLFCFILDVPKQI